MWCPRVGPRSTSMPTSSRGVEAILHGLRPDAAQVRRMVTSLARYLVRMRGRATPFGLFAGVAPARFGAPAVSQWTGEHQRRTRADGVWLAAVIARLESHFVLLRRLRV